MKQKAVVCALSALFSQHYLYAADVQPAQQVELAPVLVTADRNAQTLDKAAPNVSVIGRKTLNQASAQNLDDMVLYEPGVSVPSDNNRRGHAGINIRGIDGNRILMMVDGVRIPESYAGGGLQRRDFGTRYGRKRHAQAGRYCQRTLFRALRQRCTRRRGEHGHALAA